METTTLDSGYGTHEGAGISAEARGFLESTAKWARFLSILGFIGIGLMVLAALFASAMFSALDSLSNSGFPSFLFSVIYIVVAVIYFFPILYLFRFSSTTLNAIQVGSDEQLTEAFRFLNLHYKFIGILIIIFMAFYIIAIIGGIGAAAFLPGMMD